MRQWSRSRSGGILGASRTTDRDSMTLLKGSTGSPEVCTRCWSNDHGAPSGRLARVASSSSCHAASTHFVFDGAYPLNLRASSCSVLELTHWISYTCRKGSCICWRPNAVPTPIAANGSLGFTGADCFGTLMMIYDLESGCVPWPSPLAVFVGEREECALAVGRGHGSSNFARALIPAMHAGNKPGVRAHAVTQPKLQRMLVQVPES